jgi:hypothetical protein
MQTNLGTALKVACENAYDQYPGSCSHAVWSIIRACVNPKEEHRQANSMIDYLAANWTETTVDEGHAAAKSGVVVVGGLKGTSHGHVIVIYPADKIESGGYEYYYEKLKKKILMGSHGKYPPCLSTSIGTWPGAMSKGNKSIWDPWANDAVFAKVKFWKPKI